jgi:hypothetical protein
MPLVTAQQFPGGVPNILGGVQQGLINREAIQAEENKRRLLEQSQQQLSTRQRALGVPKDVPQDETQAQAQQRLIAADPKAAAEVLNTIGIVDQRQKEEAAAFANTVLNAPENMKKDLINQRVRELTAENRDPSHTLQLLEKSPEEINAAMKGLEATALTALQRQQAITAGARGGIKAFAPVTLINPETKEKMLAFPTFDPKTGEPGLKPGAIPEGFELSKETGEEKRQAETLEKAKQILTKEQTKQAIAASTKAFEKIQPIRKNIANYDRAIEAVDAGAETGAITTFFPSMREASIKLDQIKGELGLDVVGSVTFGALSESELAFAKDTALPTKLEGPALREWLVEKRRVQGILLEGLQEAAQFLSQGGTIGELVQKRRDEEAGQAAPVVPAAQATPAAQAAPAATAAPSQVGRFTVEIIP